MGATKLGRRAPRYRIKNRDGAVIRFRHRRIKRTITTRIFDISETGISLLVSYKLAPQIGEEVRLEFSPPGSVQIACIGRTIRVEESQPGANWKKFPDTVKVGIQFVDLPSAYKNVITSSVVKALGPHHYDRLRKAPIPTKPKRYKKPEPWIKNQWLRENAWSVMLSIFFVALFAFSMYYARDYGKRMNPNAQNHWATEFFEKVIPENRKPSSSP